MYVFCVVRHRGQGHEHRREDIHLYVWLENENKKDSNMIASALNHYFNMVCNSSCYDYKTAATKHSSFSRSFKISEAKVLEINREK